jgi:hypothetical protein
MLRHCAWLQRYGAATRMVAALNVADDATA